MQGIVLDSPISDYQFSYFNYFSDTSFLSVHTKEKEKNYVLPMFLNLW